MRKQGANSTGPDGHAIRTDRTRRRILAEALRLLNERGLAGVSTGAIATAAGVSPGNLYYHFRSKDDMVAALCEEFESRLAVRPPQGRGGAEALEDLWLYLHLMLEAMHEYRFVYQALGELAVAGREAQARIRRVARRQLEAVEDLFEGLADAGLVVAGPGERRALAANVLVVATYWPSFEAAVAPRAPAAAADAMAHAAYQVMALVAPFLAPDARRALEGLAHHYLE